MERPVFVYGTLKPGGKLYRHVADFVGDVKPARVQGRLYETPFGYPLLVPSGEEGAWVQGFLLAPKEGAQEELEEIIDCIELPAGFKKSVLRAFTESGPSVEALAYCFEEAPPFASSYPDGDWPV